MREWRKTHALSAEEKGKFRCRQRLLKAVKSGKITKKDSCEVCGSRDQIEAHHEDYTKPFDVKWLCRAHHVGMKYPMTHLLNGLDFELKYGIVPKAMPHLNIPISRNELRDAKVDALSAGMTLKDWVLSCLRVCRTMSAQSRFALNGSDAELDAVADEIVRRK